MLCLCVFPPCQRIQKKRRKQEREEDNKGVDGDDFIESAGTGGHNNVSSSGGSRSGSGSDGAVSEEGADDRRDGSPHP